MTDDSDNQHKIQILKTALIKEKQRVLDLENENKKYIEKISILESREYTNNIKYNTDQDNDEQIHNLHSENSNLKECLIQATASVNDVKDSFQNVIVSLNQKINKLQSELTNEKNELINLTQRFTSLLSQNKSFEITIQNYESKIKNNENEISLQKDLINSLESSLEDNRIKRFSLNELIKIKEETIEDLSTQLKDKKINNDTIQDVAFSGSKKELFSIIKDSKVNFLFTSINGELNLILDYIGKEKKHIPLNNFKSAIILNEEDRLIELKYFKDKKMRIKNYFIDQNPIDFISTYKSYCAMAMKLDLNKK